MEVGKYFRWLGLGTALGGTFIISWPTLSLGIALAIIGEVITTWPEVEDKK